MPFGHPREFPAGAADAPGGSPTLEDDGRSSTEHEAPRNTKHHGARGNDDARLGDADDLDTLGRGPAGDGFVATPFSERCAGLVEAGHHVFLGISPGNGYFSEDRLVALLRWAAARFTRIEVAHPGTDTVACTYLGRGYEPRHARARAYRDVRQTANRVSRAVATARLDPDRLQVAQFHDFHDTPAYRAARERIARAHREQPAFHATCTRMVTAVLRTTM